MSLSLPNDAQPQRPHVGATGAGATGLPPGTLLGEFELLRVLGDGGFGVVYLAQDHSLGRRVALKEYMPSTLALREGLNVTVRSERHAETFAAGLKSFVNEARLLARFDHPSLVKVYRFWEDNGTAYMVMPYYEGVTLKQRLKDMGLAPTQDWLLQLLEPLIDALGAIHAEQCYHRDIAPDNIILLAGSGRPLLLDFGAARRVISDMTQALTVILKPGYAPLEQYAEVPGFKQGPWTDVYALCAVVHYAITGRTPPPSVGRMMTDSYAGLIQCVGQGYTPEFLRAIDHGLKVRPDERTATVAALAADLGLGGVDLALDAAAPIAPSAAPIPPPAANLAPQGQDERTVLQPRPAFNDRTQLQPRPDDHDRTLVLPRRLDADTAPQVAPPVTPPATTPATTPAAVPFAALTAAPAAPQVAVAGAALTSPSAAAPPTAPGTAGRRGKLLALAGLAGVVLAGAVALAWRGGAGSFAPEAVVPVAPTMAGPATAPAPPVGDTAAGAAAASQTSLYLAKEFDRILAAQDTSFQVSAAPAKARLRVGRDVLQFKLSSARDGHAYVLVHGPDDSLMLLFPNSVAADNRVRAGQTLTLPQKSWPLETSEPPGPEHFMVIVSDLPRDFAALRPVSEAWFKRLSIDPGATGSGAGSAYAGRVNCVATGCDHYGAAAFTVVVER